MVHKPRNDGTCCYYIVYNFDIISAFKLYNIYQHIGNIFKTIIEIL